MENIFNIQLNWFNSRNSVVNKSINQLLSAAECQNERIQQTICKKWYIRNNQAYLCVDQDKYKKRVFLYAFTKWPGNKFQVLISR